MKKFNEWKDRRELKTIKITYRDPEDTLLKLLQHIKSVGNTGHSFTIIVDPEAKGGKKFFWDGDGADHIKDLGFLPSS